MLLQNEHCGVPIYGTTLHSKCKNCNADVTLSLNPKVIGPLVDESGQIAAGKLLWWDGAWEDLFGREVERLVGLSVGELRLLEQRMCWLRFTFVWYVDESQVLLLCSLKVNSNANLWLLLGDGLKVLASWRFWRLGGEGRGGLWFKYICHVTWVFLIDTERHCKNG